MSTLAPTFSPTFFTTATCAYCGAPLYSSKAKFDSGSGWPSFWEAVSEDAVGTAVDHSCESCGERLEVRCLQLRHAKCICALTRLVVVGTGTLRPLWSPPRPRV